MPKAVPLPVVPAVADFEILSAILREVLALRAEVARAHDRRRSPAKLADAALSAPLLHAIRDGERRVRRFSVAELLLHAAVVANLAADQRLHDAIVGAVGSLNGRRLGKLLGRLEGRELDGLRIVRVGADSERHYLARRRVCECRNLAISVRALAHA